MTSRVSRLAMGVNLWVLLGTFVLTALCLEAWRHCSFGQMLREGLTAACETVRLDYLRGGAGALTRLAENGPTRGPRVHWVDGKGNDLVTGEKDPGLAGNEAAWGLSFLKPPRRIVLQRQGLACVAEMPSLPLQHPPLFVELWGLPLMATLCCAVASIVTLRSRRLAAVLAEFGEGRLEARVEGDSSDPLGHVSQRFNEMAERVGRLVHDQHGMYAAVSHELRSPLARLTLAIRLVRNGDPKGLATLERETARLERLVDELLELSRAEADPYAMEVENVPVSELLEEIADESAIEAADHGCSLEVFVSDDCIVRGNRELLRRAVHNLVRNAIRYSPPAMPVRLGVTVKDGRAKVNVRDFGPGVPAEALGRLFEPFYRVGTAQDLCSGTGLGLSTTRRAIVLHGGGIHASNQQPGLLVEIDLPLYGLSNRGRIEPVR